MYGDCELCKREDIDGLSEHHLIPRACHGTAWFRKNFSLEDMRTRKIDVCRECHHAIHEFIPSEKELGRHYNTRELLLAHPKIAKHVAWVSRRAFQRHKVK
jgi:hypothetical protein